MEIGFTVAPVMMDGWMDECLFFVCPFFFCVFRTTHLPQKAQTNSGYVSCNDRDRVTLFEVLLGFAYFLLENGFQKILAQDNWSESPLGHRETKIW